MKRKCKSIKDKLIKKAREAMIAAVSVYNNPGITFKSETYITLVIIAWTYLLHAYYRNEGIDYRYKEKAGKRYKIIKTKFGAVKYWELTHCLEITNNPLSKEVTANLTFLIGIRHEIEHQCTDKIDEFIGAKLQACALNFDYYIGEWFGKKLRLSNQLALSIQFSKLVPEQVSVLKGNDHIDENIKNFISSFEQKLSDEICLNEKYAYRVIFVPVNVNHRGQADKVIQFVKPNSELSNEICQKFCIKETEKQKFLPGEIVNKMQQLGYIKFNMHAHTEFWKNSDAKNKKFGYGVMVAKTWYWYEPWIKIVEEYCEKNKDKFMV